MPGVHVAHFCPICLTARNGLRHPKSPVMSRTSPTRFDAWSSRCGRPEWTLGGHPHVLGRRVVRWKGGTLCPNASGVGQGALRALCTPRPPGCALGP
jgi:hypothetical protein